MFGARSVVRGLVVVFLFGAALRADRAAWCADSLLTAPPPPVPHAVVPTCPGSTATRLEATWLPARPEEAMAGSQFAEHTRGWKGRARQRAALEELRKGNMPAFLRRLVPVHLEAPAPDGHQIRATVWVTPDYLSIGSDSDFLRMPLTRPSAVGIAEEFGFVLPTRKIVDAVHAQAAFHLAPQPMRPGPGMRSSEYYLEHHRMIEAQRQGRPLGELVSGHKKDMVLTSSLLGPERIAIYGWFRKSGKRIQPLSTVHDARYADYSHGVRLVYAIVCVDGESRSIYDVLEDPLCGRVLTYEGLIPSVRKLMHW